jgi:hypothetical protein
MKTFGAILVLTVMPSVARAQSAGLPAEGERVRARLVDWKDREDWVVGRLVEVGDGSIRIKPAKGEVVEIPLRRLDRLDRSLGQRSLGKSTLRGAGYGLVGGAALGVLVGSMGSGGFLAPEPQEAAVVVGLAGAALGGFIGLGAPGERWEKTEPGAWRVSVAPARGGVAASVRFSF